MSKVAQHDSAQKQQKPQKNTQEKLSVQVRQTSNYECQFMEFSIYRSEAFWKFNFIIITVISAIPIYNIFQFQTLPIFENVRNGSLFELLTYGLIFSLFFTSLDLIIHKIFDPLCYKHFLNLEKYPKQDDRIKRSYTLVKWGYSSIYYIGTSIGAYMILLDSNALPYWLGGTGNSINFYKPSPQIFEATNTMRVFYIIQFGKHFSRLFSHVFMRPQGNFYEYTLHHGLSCYLMLFSYLTNFWLVGIMILLLHDITDISLTLGRSYREYKNYNNYLLQFLYISGFLNWFFWRIFVFSYVCIYPAISYGSTQFLKADPQIFKTLALPGYFMILMMIALEVMQIFWTYYLVRAFLSVSVSSKIKHTYDGFSELKSEKKQNGQIKKDE